MSVNADKIQNLNVQGPSREGSKSPYGDLNFLNEPPMSLGELKKRRGIVKARVTHIEKHVKKLSGSSLSKIQKLELQLRVTQLESIYDEFNPLQSRIEYICDESELAVHLEYRSIFDETFFATVSLIKALTEDSCQNVEEVVKNATNLSENIAVRKSKLPDVTLPSFTGSYDGWLEFKNSFYTMIHKRTDLDPIEKFHYLRAALSGSARQVISALEFTAENYEYAWELLLNRFQNERLLVNNHVKALFSLPKINKESSFLIRKLIDSVTRNLRSLKSLEEPTDSWDTLIIHIMVSKLDPVTEREWETYKGNLTSIFKADKPKQKLKLNDLLTFLNNRADLLDSLTNNSNNSLINFQKSNTNHNYSKPSTAVQAQTNSYVAANINSTDTKLTKRKRVCEMCRGNHPLYVCSMFLNLSVEDRIKLVSDKNLCGNCLRGGHSLDDCYFGPCQQCKQKHNSLLHKTDKNSVVLHSLSSNSNLTSNMHSLITQPVLLSTALVQVSDSNNIRHMARALLDNGSQHCFISNEFCKRINYRNFIQSTVQISGVGQSVSHSNKSCELTIFSNSNQYSKKIRCYVLQNITTLLPTIQIDINSLQLPTNIRLADPNFNVPSNIDLLLGADVFWDLLNENKIRLSSGPYLQDSKLGWLISGAIDESSSKNMSKINKTSCNFSQTEINLDAQLKRFWEIEELPAGARNSLTINELKCEEIFTNSIKRECDGRFSVRIPLKESADSLGDSYTTAHKRFISLENKLKRNPTYKRMYSDFMQEYRALGHMTKVNTYEWPYYFLPHHGVFKEGSSTTKLRVVYDASCPTTNNKSLNDIQYIGPKLQNDIFSILLRFRQYQYVACADIEKAYRQTLIQPDQRNLQLIMWRENPSEPIDIYRLNTITYGTASAPYLCIRCLHQVAQECDDKVISKVIKNDFFVDDLLTSHDDRETLVSICEKTSNILAQYGYPLRKWTFNCDLTTTCKDLSIDEYTQTKTLGLGWHNINDEFYFTTKLSIDNSPLTKRKILSIVSQIYDPLGFLAPTIIIAKTLLQSLWLCKLGWDETLPGDITIKFRKFINSIIIHLNDIKIPRFVRNINSKRLELLIFSDASQVAFGSVAYVRTFVNSSVQTKLLCAKTRVAPLKTLTIPRLELCGALIGARLYKMIIDSIHLTFDAVYFFTDSSIVIGWLNTSQHLLKTFVQNRVNEINELTNEAPWLHVDSNSNPADLLSRGLNINDLKNSDMWWHGPPFLNSVDWVPSKKSKIQCENLPEIKTKIVTALSTSSEPLIDFERFSSFNRLRRVGAYVLRFIHNSRKDNKQVQRTGLLSVVELEDAQKMLSRFAQMQSFPSLYNKLINNKPLLNCKESKRVLGLNVFIDDFKLIRVGGRLTNSSNIEYSKRHPILLCSKSRFAMLLFQYHHRRLFHGGAQLLLYTIRESWWPLAGRNLARKIMNQCIICTRIKGKTLAPLMGNLPKERLDGNFPFIRVGVDYSGPIFILNRKGRGSRLVKSYICLFVCFLTRCIHLELVSSLTTADYILALKRFISRRGKPLEIFSDNGTNFVGAEKEFPLLLKNSLNEITNFTANDGIIFRFIPPHSPHFGGLWESGVKSCKHHLRRVLGNARLTYEEFSTVLVQIESVLNSRPISCLSTDPSDSLPLTPAHFLIGRPMTAPTEADITEIQANRLTRYQRVEQLRQHFWKRWSLEYVTELQVRTKWKVHQSDIKLDSLVLIKDDHQPPLQWRMGRIIRVFPGNDGIRRVAEIRTATGTIQRAFSKICPLPITPLDAISTALPEGTTATEDRPSSVLEAK